MMMMESGVNCINHVDGEEGKGKNRLGGEQGALCTFNKKSRAVLLKKACCCTRILQAKSLP